ncbi:peptidyl-tRNA hydrolase [Syntrophus gentianae]|uniref:Peptidyl-tRNA hydrolase n=1 Tax=Syntrophus gentianae TaxID=43775 RepID=A0A1H7YHV8_9BACT|nr:aminoacyl-tRNA hydrolase [Syntrophus gentianae]SEM45700.1 peptidyl-tRNA hydrolase [Syntrophus gentianae]
MKLIVGLGNPGARYRFTRHNFGFLVLDRLAADQELNVTQAGFDALWGKGIIAGQNVLLAKPQTFMNLSGKSVRKLTDYFKIAVEDVVVVHDDLDLPFGTIRLKAGGGQGGHKGLISIYDALGGPEFQRVRLGIGKPVQRFAVERYVLEPFTESELPFLPKLLATAENAIIEVISSGIKTAMNKYNGLMNNNLFKEVC